MDFRKKLIPSTFLGRLSAGFFAGLIIFFIVMNIFVMLGERGGDTFSDNLKLSIPAVLMIICGISSFFTGLISIIKDRERSWIVFITSLIGFLLLIFLMSEFIFPH